jgi:hypothetical protein
MLSTLGPHCLWFEWPIIIHTTNPWLWHCKGFACNCRTSSLNSIVRHLSHVHVHVHVHTFLATAVSLGLGRAIAQAVSRWLPTRRPRFEPRSGHVGFVVGKVALGQDFGFPYQFSIHQLLHIHHHLSSESGTIGEIVADLPSRLVLTPPQETRKN